MRSVFDIFDMDNCFFWFLLYRKELEFWTKFWISNLEFRFRDLEITAHHCQFYFFFTLAISLICEWNVSALMTPQKSVFAPIPSLQSWLCVSLKLFFAVVTLANFFNNATLYIHRIFPTSTRLQIRWEKEGTSSTKPEMRTPHEWK